MWDANPFSPSPHPPQRPIATPPYSPSLVLLTETLLHLQSHRVFSCIILLLKATKGNSRQDVCLSRLQGPYAIAGSVVSSSLTLFGSIFDRIHSTYWVCSIWLPPLTFSCYFCPFLLVIVAGRLLLFLFFENVPRFIYIPIPDYFITGNDIEDPNAPPPPVPREVVRSTTTSKKKEEKVAPSATSFARENGRGGGGGRGYGGNEGGLFPLQ